MKKLSAMLVAFILVAATAFTAFAAGINDSEQAVLNELKTSVKMNGSEMVIPSEFVNQAENYFNTIDMTADESSQIVAILKKGESFLENSGASNIADLTFAQKQTLLSYGKEVVGVLDMTMSYDTSSKKLTIYGKDGKVGDCKKYGRFAENKKSCKRRKKNKCGKTCQRSRQGNRRLMLVAKLRCLQPYSVLAYGDRTRAAA